MDPRESSMSAQETRLRAEMIVANLPYVRTEEMTQLEPELAWEPKTRLGWRGRRSAADRALHPTSRRSPCGRRGSPP